MRRQYNPGPIYFDVTWFGEDWRQFKLQRTPAGVGSTRSWFGIDWYGLRAAAKFGGYKWNEFCGQNMDVVSSTVAEYRIRGSVESLISAWQAERVRNKK